MQLTNQCSLWNYRFLITKNTIDYSQILFVCFVYFVAKKYFGAIKTPVF